MDLDVLEKHARAIVAFRAELEEALPEIRKALADASTLADDVAKIKETLGPALEWIAEQQKAADEAKAAGEKKAAEEHEAQERHAAEQAREAERISEERRAAEAEAAAQMAAKPVAEPLTEPLPAEAAPIVETADSGDGTHTG